MPLTGDVGDPPEQARVALDNKAVEERLSALGSKVAEETIAFSLTGEVVLAEGAKVSYDSEAGDKGPKAVNVSVI